MLLTLDLGNTNITIGIFDKKTLVMHSRIATDCTKMEDEYAVILTDIFQLYHIASGAFTGAIISSVVPPLDRALRGAVRQVTGLSPLLVEPGTKTGMDIRIDNPAQLGADLLVGAVAAVARVGVPCMVWDLGTATKVSVVDTAGAFRGGAIMPGVGISLDSLITRASLLPRIGLDAPPHAIGTNTIQCMQSGMVFGTAAMIDGMCDRMEAELGAPVTILATGGWGREVVTHCKRTITYVDELLLEGLQIIFEKNKQ